MKIGAGIPDVVELLRMMVSFDTVNATISGRSGPEEPLARRLAEMAMGAGFQTHLFPVPEQAPNLLVLYEKDAVLPWILFDSHLDTVTVDGMTIEPFGGEVRDGKLWGRGSCDTKGTGAAMLVALAEYARGVVDDMNEEAARGGSQRAESWPANTAGNNVAILYSVDEEVGTAGIREFVATNYPRLGIHFKGAVVGEPTSLAPVVAHSGGLGFKVTTRGVAAHSSTPSRGRSAVSSMARLVLFLESTYIPAVRRSHALAGTAECSINVIRGGSALNVIPDECEIFIDRRTLPEESLESVVSGFRLSLEEFRKANPSVELDHTVLWESPPMVPPVESAFVDRVCSVLEDFGHDATPQGVSYTTHGGELSLADIPTVVLGPGGIAQAHTKDEWIDIDNLRDGVAVYRRIMQIA